MFYGLNDRNRNVTNTNGRLSHLQRVGEVDISIASDFRTTPILRRRKTRKPRTARLPRHAWSDRAIRPSPTTWAKVIWIPAPPRTLSTPSPRNSASVKTSGYVPASMFQPGQLVYIRNHGSTSGRTEQNGDLTASGRLGDFRPGSASQPFVRGAPSRNLLER